MNSFIFVVTVLFLNVCLGFPEYRDNIPNGDKVPNPCKDVPGTWQGVGHDNKFGGGARNVFGIDFKEAGFKWTSDLCKKDSDSDGMTNGQELGDPDCTWTKGGMPSFNATRHPGVCEPMDSDKCTTVNSKILCF